MLYGREERTRGLVGIGNGARAPGRTGWARLVQPRLGRYPQRTTRGLAAELGTRVRGREEHGGSVDALWPRGEDEGTGRIKTVAVDPVLLSALLL